jgi:uncharacterized membrane protein
MMTEQENTASTATTRLIHRVIFFSDAVFAIALTLLVLELRPPPHGEDTRTALTALIPHFAAFAGSFAVISIFWAAHLAITRRLIAFDWITVWVNLGFLFTIALMPFASALLGEHGARGIVWQVYCAVLIAASIAQTALWLAASRERGRLLGGVTWRERAYRALRALSPAIAFGIGLWAVGTAYEQWAVLCWVLIFPLVVASGLLFGVKHE